MKTIDYSPTGEAIPDHAAENRAREFLQGSQDAISVSTENFIDASRALVYEGLVPHTEVRFMFKGELLQHDKDMRFLRYPPRGFCDWTSCWLSRLL